MRDICYDLLPVQGTKLTYQLKKFLTFKFLAFVKLLESIAELTIVQQNIEEYNCIELTYSFHSSSLVYVY